MSLPTTINRSTSIAIDINDLGQAMEFAEVLAGTNIVPKQYQNRPGDCLVAMMMGAELGLNAIQSLQHIATVNGRPSIYGDAMLAIVKRHPDFVKIIETFDPETNTARCELHRKDAPVVIQEFGQRHAEQAGLWKKAGPWSQYPGRMMKFRARGFAIRDQFPDAILGLVTREEAADMDDVSLVEMTPGQVTAADLNRSIAGQIEHQGHQGADQGDEKEKAAKGQGHQETVVEGHQDVQGGQDDTATLELTPGPSQEPDQAPPPPVKKTAKPRGRPRKSPARNEKSPPTYADIADRIKAANGRMDALEALKAGTYLESDLHAELMDLVNSLYPA